MCACECHNLYVMDMASLLPPCGCPSDCTQMVRPGGELLHQP